MDRAEHLEWAKQRALELLDTGPEGWVEAISSLHMDFRSHPQLEGHDGPMLMSTMAFGGQLCSNDQVRQFITTDLR